MNRVKGEGLEPIIGANPSGSEESGVSNTPDAPYWKSTRATSIDYLKFRFDLGFGKESFKFEKLLTILHIRRDEAHIGRGINGYTRKMDLTIGISLWYGGSFTKTKNGEETTVLELKGSGCRQFEDLYLSNYRMDGGKGETSDILRKAWTELIEESLSLGGHCTRVDLPTDDFSGEITVNQIKHKINNREFTTKMRKVDFIKTSEEDEENEKPLKTKRLKDNTHVEDSKLTGYTVTFGGRDAVQLCIYDKKAERLSKGIECLKDTWIRYEVRYYHENAEKEIIRLLQSLHKGEQSLHIVGCLSSLFEFKEKNKFGEDNRSKAKVWDKWGIFLEGAILPESFSNSPTSMSIESNCSWLMLGCSKAFGRIISSLDIPIREAASALVVRFIDKSDNSDLQTINQYRRNNKTREYKNLDELRLTLLHRRDLSSEYHESTTRLLLSRKTKGEIEGLEKEKRKESIRNART